MAKQSNIRVRRKTEKAKVVKDYGEGVYSYKKGSEIEFHPNMRDRLEKLGVISNSKGSDKSSESKDSKKDDKK